MAIRQGSRQGPVFAPNKTPAPDEITNVRNPTAAGHGMNGYSGASSIDPGKRVLSPLAQNLESSVDDPAISRVIASGTKLDASITGQLRSIGQGNVPINRDTKGPRKS